MSRLLNIPQCVCQGRHLPLLTLWRDKFELNAKEADVTLEPSEEGLI